VTGGDLPILLRRRFDDFPARPGYLAADADRAREFRTWLESAAPGVRRLGLCWRSGLRTEDRSRYYPALGDCAPLAMLPGVRLVALQYDDFTRELAESWPQNAAPLLIPPDLDRRDDLDGVAALMTVLDGVLTADTAVLALAGAVGAPTVAFGRRPTWVALGRPRPPWYPSVTSIYRGPGESWSAMMQRIANAATGPLVPPGG
jgi:hypothetical protein